MAEDGSAVWEAEQELKLAQLAEEYDPILDQAREAPEDEALRARKAELAGEIVAIRMALREKREADASALMDGAARPAPVESKTGVNE